MADILIKEMEMPKGNEMGTNIVIFSDGSVWTGGVWQERIKGVKAIELPSHGRLVSESDLASLLIADIQRLDTTDEYTDEERELVRTIYKSCLYKLAITSTVVEASK